MFCVVGPKRRSEALLEVPNRVNSNRPPAYSAVRFSHRIRRDIEILSYTEPIYTQSGRHIGGVYVVDGYHTDRMYMAEEEVAILQKIKDEANKSNSCLLLPGEEKTLDRMIRNYAKPKNN